MLILSRKNCESVVVGDPAGHLEQMLKVTVLEIGRGTVRLGFEVAGDVPVNRLEVVQRIRASARYPGPANRSHGTAMNRCGSRDRREDANALMVKG
jgi:carbon storage regulator CsrA